MSCSNRSTYILYMMHNNSIKLKGVTFLSYLSTKIEQLLTITSLFSLFELFPAKN